MLKVSTKGLPLVCSSMHFDDTCARRFIHPCEMPRQDRAYSKKSHSTTSVFLSNMQQVSAFVTSHHQAQIKIQTKKQFLHLYTLQGSET